MSEAISQAFPKVDGRRARGWWHDEARQMKRDGFSLQEIADKFCSKKNYVANLTKGIPAKRESPKRFSFIGAASGHQYGNGNFKRVAIGFTEKQISIINAIAEERDVSFSKAVADLVDIAIEEIVS